MSKTFGPNLGLLINANDGEQYSTEFRALLRGLDILAQPTIIDRTIATPPGSPSNGARYLVPTGGTGAWSGKDNNIAVWTTSNPATPTGLWEFYPPKNGFTTFCLADSSLLRYQGGWSVVYQSNPAGGMNLPVLNGDVNAAMYPSVQAAINATPVGGTLYIPSGDYVLTGGTSTEVLLITQPINIVGAGWQSRLMVPANVGGTTDVIRVVGNALFPNGTTFRNFSILPVSGTPARYGINFDSTTNYNAYMQLDHLQIGLFGSNAVGTTNPTLTDGFFIVSIQDSLLSNAFNLDRVSDSVRLYHNTITGTLPMRVNFVGGTDGGAHGFEFVGNNVTNRGGMHIINASRGFIGYNDWECTDITGSSNNAMLDIDGVTGQHVIGLTVAYNYLGCSATGADTIRVNFADNTIITGNTTVRASGGKTYRITANATATAILNDINTPSGELPASFLADLGTNTIFRWASPQGEQYLGTVGNKTNAVVIPIGTSQGSTAPFRVTDNALSSFFRIFPNGHVVIGSDSDSGSIFQVNGTSFFAASATFGGILNMAQGQDIDGHDSANTAIPMLSMHNDNVVRIGMHAAPASAGDLLLYSNGTEKARVNPAGVLCVNTTAPLGTEKLSVNGNILAVGRISDSHITVSFSITPVFNASTGSSFDLTLTGNVGASTLSNTVAGQKITFVIVQDATGGRSFTWPTNVFGGGLIDALHDSGVANAVCIQTFIVRANGNAYPISPMTIN
jgi:hypothetical protein